MCTMFNNIIIIIMMIFSYLIQYLLIMMIIKRKKYIEIDKYKLANGYNNDNIDQGISFNDLKSKYLRVYNYKSLKIQLVV